MSSPTGEAEDLRGGAQTTGRSVMRGGAWTLAASIVPQLQILTLSIAAARFLGQDAMGRQSFIAFVVSSVVIIGTAGLPAGLSRFVAELQGARLGGVARTLFWWTWRIELATAALGVAGLGAAALLGASPLGAWALAALGCGLAVLQTVPSALLTGVQRWRQATLAGMATGFISVPATIAVLAAGGGITGFFAVEAATLAINLAWIGTLARNVLVQLPPGQPVPARYRRDYLQFAGATTLFSVIELVVWRRSEFVFLASYTSNEQIALYSIAFAASTALTRLPEAITAVTTPAVASLAGAGQHDRIRTGYWRGLRLLVLVTPVIAAGAAALGPEALELLYGSEYSGVRPVFLLLIAPLPLLPLLSMTQAVLFALGRLRFLIIVGLAATIVNVTLDVVLIPVYEAVGAAVANAGAQVAAGVPGLIYASRVLGPVNVPVGAVLRSTATAAVTGLAAVGAVETLGGLPGVMAGSVVAGLTLLLAGALLRPLTAADAEWLSELGSSRWLGLAARWFSRPSKDARPR